MDKKTIIGLVLMVAVFVGYSFYMGHEQEEAEKIRREKVEKQRAAAEAQAIIEAEKAKAEEAKTPEQKAAEKAQAEVNKHNEELAYHGATLIDRYNVDNVEPIVVENEVMTVTLNPIGGKISSVVLKEYNRYGKDESVNLINPGSAYFGIDIHRHGAGHEAINTNDYLFDYTPVVNKDGEIEKVVMSLPIDEEGGLVKYTYSLNRTGDASKDHLVDFDLDVVGLTKYLRNNGEIILRWKSESMRNEKSFTNESVASTIMYYDNEEEESNEIDATGKREHHRNLDWIALKQQYFTSALMAEDVMHVGMGFSTAKDGNSGYVKAFDTRIIIPNDGDGNYSIAFYYGPNDYKIMNGVSFAGKESNLDEIIPMGGWFIGWFNRYLTIPIFNWLSDHGLGFGLIILILTLIVKLIILPLTYKSYMSTAKMRAIRPEMEEINQKYPKPEDAMKKQQALMDLYRKAGVSPMGGCLPLLIQMPILWAMSASSQQVSRFVARAAFGPTTYRHTIASLTCHSTFHSTVAT